MSGLIDPLSEAVQDYIVRTMDGSKMQKLICVGHVTYMVDRQRMPVQDALAQAPLAIIMFNGHSLCAECFPSLFKQDQIERAKLRVRRRQVG